MASQEPHRRPSLYPEVDQSNPEATSAFIPNPNRNPTTPPSTSSNLYPTIVMDDLVQNLFPDTEYRNPNSNADSPSAPPEPDPVEETIISIPGAIVHLIDKEYSAELACGNFSIVGLRQGDHPIAVLARVDDEVQWPLMKDEAAVKVDDSHYFFSLRAPKGSGSGSDSSDEEGNGKGNRNQGMVLNYGLSFASKGQEKLLKELDGILESYCSFSVHKVSEKSKEGVLDAAMTKDLSPEDLRSEGKRAMIEETSAAYWTTLAPNVEDYSSSAARLIAAGSGQLIKGILWCGDVTVDRLKWGNEVLVRRMSSSKQVEVSPDVLKRIRRAKKVTKMTEKVANGVLSGVVKVSGYFTSSVVNSKAGKKFFSLLPGEIALASLDAFNKICDAAEVAGKNVMSTSSTVTTGLVSHRYGEEAGKATNEGLGAAGHAIGTAWAVFKLRKALNPKSSVKASSIAKSAVKAAAAEHKSRKK